MMTLLRRMGAPGGPLRYAAGGLVNTAFGYAGILAASLAGLPPVLANAAGFLVGLAVSWVVARLFTFAPPKRGGAGRRYAAAFVSCWSLNAGLMSGALAAGIPEAVAQAIGVAAYACAFYLGCRWWVFGDAATLRDDAALARGALAKLVRDRRSAA